MPSSSRPTSAALRSSRAARSRAAGCDGSRTRAIVRRRGHRDLDDHPSGDGRRISGVASCVARRGNPAPRTRARSPRRLWKALLTARGVVAAVATTRLTEAAHGRAIRTALLSLRGIEATFSAARLAEATHGLSVRAALLALGGLVAPRAARALPNAAHHGLLTLQVIRRRGNWLHLYGRAGRVFDLRPIRRLARATEENDSEQEKQRSHPALLAGERDSPVQRLVRPHRHVDVCAGERALTRAREPAAAEIVGRERIRLARPSRVVHREVLVVDVDAKSGASRNHDR